MVLRYPAIQVWREMPFLLIAAVFMLLFMIIGSLLSDVIGRRLPLYRRPRVAYAVLAILAILGTPDTRDIDLESREFGVAESHVARLQLGE